MRRQALLAAVLALGFTFEVRCDRPVDPWSTKAPCNLSGYREGPRMQGTHYGFHIRLLDLSRKGPDGAPLEVTTADGLRGHAAGETVRLRVEILDAKGKAPDFPVVLFVAVADPAWETDRWSSEAPARRASLGTLRLAGTKTDCDAIQVLWRPRDSTGKTVTPNDELEYTVGTAARLAGFVPEDDDPSRTEPLWAKSERLDILAGGDAQSSVAREIETAIPVRVGAGPPVALRWSDRAPRPAHELTVATGDVERRLTIGGLYSLVDRHGNVVATRFPTSVAKTPGASTWFGALEPDGVFEDATYGLRVTVPAGASPGDVVTRLLLNAGGRTIEQPLTVHLREPRLGSLEPLADDDDESGAREVTAPGEERRRCGFTDLARTAFRHHPVKGETRAPLVDAWLEDATGKVSEDAVLESYGCDRSRPCDDRTQVSWKGRLSGVTPGPDGYLAFGIRQSPRAMGDHLLVLRARGGATVQGLREPFLTRSHAVTVSGLEIRNDELGSVDGTTWLDSLIARHVVVVDGDETDPIELFLSSRDQDGDDLGEVERLSLHRIGRSRRFVGRFDTCSRGSFDATHRPARRRPLALGPGNLFVVAARDAVTADGRPPKEPPSPDWNELVTVNEKEGKAILFARWSRPPVAADERGGFVVTWQDEDNANPFAVRVRRFGPKGPVTPEITVDEGHYVEDASVACDAAGTFVVAWRVSDHVEAQAYTPSGQRTGERITIPKASSPAIAMTPEGAILLSWVSRPREGWAENVLVTRPFGIDGKPRGDTRILTSSGNGAITHARLVPFRYPSGSPVGSGHVGDDLARGVGGGVGAPRSKFADRPAYLVTWSESPSGSNGPLKALRLDAAGNALGQPIVITESTFTTQMDSRDGHVLIGWSRFDETVRHLARWLDAAGNLGPELTLEHGGAFALEPAGLLTTVEEPAGWPERGVLVMRRHRRDVQSPPRRAEDQPERVDPGEPGSHSGSQIVSDAQGNLVVVWRVFRDEGKKGQIVSRRYPAPAKKEAGALPAAKRRSR